MLVGIMLYFLSVACRTEVSCAQGFLSPSFPHVPHMMFLLITVLFFSGVDVVHYDVGRRKGSFGCEHY